MSRTRGNEALVGEDFDALTMNQYFTARSKALALWLPRGRTTRIESETGLWANGRYRLGRVSQVCECYCNSQ
jgi:hypothetical protein